jgi:hypothetical protein
VDLADEAVDIDDQPPAARSRSGVPRARQRDARHAVQLTDVPERECAQKRAQRRRRRDPAAQQPTRATRAQYVAVIDAVRAQRHRIDQRHDLAASIARAGPVGAQTHHPLRERLDPQSSGERRDEHDPGVRDRPLVIEADLHGVQSDRSVIVHHEGDLLRGPRIPTHPGQALLCVTNAEGDKLCRKRFLKRCCARDGGSLALQRRSCGDGR